MEIVTICTQISTQYNNNYPINTTIIPNKLISVCTAHRLNHTLYANDVLFNSTHLIILWHSICYDITNLIF